MTLALGESPGPLTVTLVSGDDFRRGVRRDDGSFWPDGCSFRLVFGDNDFSWAAQFSGTDAIWDVDAEFVDQVIDLNLRRVSLVYSENGLDRVTHRGTVNAR